MAVLRMAVGLGGVLYVVLVCLLVWLVSWRIRRYFGRQLKARQDLARSVSDVADRLEHIERKLETPAETEH